MPIYEYTCLVCENHFEKLVFNREAKVECPQCQSENVEKQFSVFGFKSAGSSASTASSASSSCSGCHSHNCSSCH